MPQFHPLRSDRTQHTNDLAGELYPDIFSDSPSPITKSPNGVLIERSPVLTEEAFERSPIQTDQLSAFVDQPYSTGQLPFTGGQQVVRTDQLTPVTGALDVKSTQSLVAALQSTMTAPQKKLRRPVVIPGNKKAGAGKKALENGLPARRMQPHVRTSIVMTAFLGIMVFSLLALSPLGQAENGLPIVGPLSQWVHVQQQNWDTFTAHVFDNGQQANTTAQQPVAAPPPMMLPTSQYVAIARQDAINAGISPDYFSRQIMVESGFNPNATSPAGAVGIAQFLPSTAASLGFNPYDPIAALKGAAQYMASFNKQYGGDYAKALAAYNAGSGTVNYAVQQGGANWMNFLPAETQNYIYKIMGV